MIVVILLLHIDDVVHGEDVVEEDLCVRAFVCLSGGKNGLIQRIWMYCMVVIYRNVL